MPADWPDTLPQRLFVSGSQEGAADGRLKSQTDTGPGKVRPRSSAMSRPLAGTMRMNSAQLDILLDFVSTTGATAGGSLPFSFPAPRGSGTWLVRFGDNMPSWTNVGGDRYNVSITLEVLP